MRNLASQRLDGGATRRAWRILTQSAGLSPAAGSVESSAHRVYCSDLRCSRGLATIVPTMAPVPTELPDPVRVAIIADTHGQLDSRVAARVAAHDVVVHAGDIGARHVIAALAPRLGRIIAVRGNNDTLAKWPRADRHFLERLAPSEIVALPGGALVVVHGDRAGTPATRHQWLRAVYPQARAIVYGHSHRHCLDRAERPWVLNPGAAGRARTFGGPSFISLSAGSARWRARLTQFESARDR